MALYYDLEKCIPLAHDEFMKLMNKTTTARVEAAQYLINKLHEPAIGSKWKVKKDMHDASPCWPDTEGKIYTIKDIVDVRKPTTELVKAAILHRPDYKGATMFCYLENFNRYFEPAALEFKGIDAQIRNQKAIDSGIAYMDEPNECPHQYKKIELFTSTIEECGLCGEVKK